jgi:hypothetical protein
VIARNREERHFEPVEERPRRLEFRAAADLREIATDDHKVWMLAREVGSQA